MSSCIKCNALYNSKWSLNDYTLKKLNNFHNQSNFVTEKFVQADGSDKDGKFGLF